MHFKRPSAVLLFVLLPVLSLFCPGPLHADGLSATDGPAPGRPRMAFSLSTQMDKEICSFYEALYVEAFRRLGMDFELRLMPARRCLHEVDHGGLDGDVARVHALGDDPAYPNLVRVEEPVMAYELVGYTPHQDLVISGWASLARVGEQGYVIGYRQGFRAAEVNIPKYAPAARTLPVSDEETAIRMIHAGRIDVLLEPALATRDTLRRKTFLDQGLHMAGVLETANVYPYLNVKHAALAPLLAQVMRDMKQEGVFKAIEARTRGLAPTSEN